MDRLKDKSLYLLDMDGTIYHENDLIDGAADFIDTLIKRDIDYVFMTNNSSKSAESYVEKLHRLGIPAERKNMFTSGQATAIYLNENCPDAKVYVMGTDSLKKEIGGYGISVYDTPEKCVDTLLVGYDTELTYKKLEDACGLLCEGVKFFATNPDVVCPAKKGRYLPDCATMCYMLEKATGRTPYYIGKPRPEMALCAVNERRSTPDKAVLIGDRLYTDIACGLAAGILAVLVLSGEATREDIEKLKIYPDIVTDSVKSINIKLNSFA